MIKGRLLPWMEAPGVSIGRFQSWERINKAGPDETQKLDWVRRPTGGRAVLHHQELTYALVMRASDGWD